MLNLLIEQLAQAKSLSPEQVADAVNQLTDEQVPSPLKADFLTALARKGETTEEIAAFASLLRDKALSPPLDLATRQGEILDVCGTGGDRLNTFNISTTVALIVAAAGVTVAKHGNRAITSQAGSADVLEALGVRIDLSPEAAAGFLRDHRFAFFFAPKYHPAFKHIGPARKLCAERGQRTLFNFLGPLLNPVRPTAQLIGVPRPEWCEPIARVLQSLGVRRGMVVCGGIESKVQGPMSKVQVAESDEKGSTEGGGKKPVYLDEFSTLGPTTIAEFYQDRGFNTSEVTPDYYPVQAVTLADLVGGDRQRNAEIILGILGGDDRGPKRDAVLLNSAAALLVAGQSRTMLEGWNVAAELIDGGKALAKLQELVAASK